MNHGQILTDIHNLRNRIENIYDTAAEIVHALETQIAKQLAEYFKITKSNPLSLNIEFAGIDCILKAELPLSNKMDKGYLTTYFVTDVDSKKTLTPIGPRYTFDALGNIDGIYSSGTFMLVFIGSLLNALLKENLYVTKTPQNGQDEHSNIS